MTKPTKWHVCPAKTQISLGIRPVWSEYSLCAKWVAKDPSFLHADSEDSDQTGWTPRLIWDFTGRTCHFVGFLFFEFSNFCFCFYTKRELFVYKSNEMWTLWSCMYSGKATIKTPPPLKPKLSPPLPPPPPPPPPPHPNCIKHWIRVWWHELTSTKNKIKIKSTWTSFCLKDKYFCLDTGLMEETRISLTLPNDKKSIYK